MLRLLTNVSRVRSKVLDLVVSSFGRHINQQPPIALATVDYIPNAAGTTTTTTSQSSPSIADCLWLAVPKSKISRSKKRMKTTTQKRIHKKQNIIVDSRTGEITLRHKLPFNWKDYLPDN